MSFSTTRASRALGAFLSNAGTVQQRALRGVVWILFSSWFSKVMFSVQTIVLVRLLKPSDFGVVGILTMIVGTMDVFTSGGIDSAIIQRKELDRDSLDTAWVLQVLRGILKFALLYAAAAPLASFYDTPILESVIKVYGLTYLFSGFRNIGMLIFTREINFRTITLTDQLRNLLTILVTLGCAYYYRSFWAIIAGYVTAEVIAIVISFWIHPYRPSFRLKLHIARELINFGRHILISGIIIHIINRGDDALVGKALGLDALGFYTVAYGLATLPSSYISDTMFRITFPTFSKLQGNPDSLRSSYLKTLQFVSLLAIPASAGIALLAPDIVRVVYGEKWIPMVDSVRVLCIFGMIRAIVSIGGGLFQGVGKPQYLTYVSLVQLIIMAAIIYPLTTTYGILGTSMAVVAPMVIVQGWAMVKTAQIVREKLRTIMRLIAVPTVGSLAMAPAIYLARYCFDFKASVPLLACYVLLGILTYSSVILLLDRKTWQEARRLVESLG